MPLLLPPNPPSPSLSLSHTHTHILPLLTHYRTHARTLAIRLVAGCFVLNNGCLAQFLCCVCLAKDTDCSPPDPSPVCLECVWLLQEGGAWFSVWPGSHWSSRPHHHRIPFLRVCPCDQGLTGAYPIPSSVFM